MYQISITIKDEHLTKAYLTHYKRRPNVDLRTTLYSQDFTTLNKCKPTTYKTKIRADMVAIELRDACDRIAEDVLLELDINRTFTIEVERIWLVDL